VERERVEAYLLCSLGTCLKEAERPTKSATELLVLLATSGKEKVTNEGREVRNTE
jgi:hypothetical protein